MNSQEIDSLAARLRKASSDYYGGTPSMSDAAFDALEARLRAEDPTNAVFAEVGAPLDSGWPKVDHPIVMGSLNKAQTLESYHDWAGPVDASCSGDAEKVYSEKLDGISILLTYKGGVLFRAETRGDGHVGEDITRNVRVMEGVPPQIPQKGTAWVRGEVVCRRSQFKEHFQGESNPRNTASGTAKRQSGWQKCQYLTVMAYNLTVEGAPSTRRSAELARLEFMGFKTPNWGILTGQSPMGALYGEYILSRRAGLDYDIDGLVIEINSTTHREEFGARDGRPKAAIALKFPHESSKTVLNNIVWQVGNTGRVTPVAEFEEVSLAGANVSRASLHNVGNIERLVGAAGQQFAHSGDEILVSRRNDVIPYVESFLGTSQNPSAGPFTTPTECPKCAHPLETEGAYLVCNGLNCSSQVLGSILRWIGKLNILNFGGAQVRALIEAGLVNTIPDLYRLTEQQIRDCEMDGRKIGGNAKRILASLEKSKELTLAQMVGSLGIPLCGRKMVSLLVDAGIDSLSKMASSSISDLEAVPGFGSGRAEAFRKGFDERRELIVHIIAVGVQIKQPELVEVTGSALAGDRVCFTGVRDKDAEAAIVAQGGEIASGVSKTTTILVCKDPSSNTGKAKKARTLGLDIITLDELWVRLGGRS
jgi:DNA ligase (NAD+)